MTKQLLCVMTLGVVVIAAGGLGYNADAAVIYSESFGGIDANPLNATPPDIRPGSETWVASTLWSETGKKTSSGNANAFLPFSPVAGKVYTLKASLNPDVGGGTEWLALGFAQSNDTAVDFWQSPNDASPWVLFRENDAAANVIVTFTGTGVTGGSNHDLAPDKVGPVEFTIELDTTAASWTAEWYEDGNSLRTHTFGTNPTITHVGFGGLTTVTGSVSDFSLEVVPEPSTFALSALGLLGLLAWGRRTRR